MHTWEIKKTCANWDFSDSLGAYFRGSFILHPKPEKRTKTVTLGSNLAALDFLALWKYVLM